FAAALSYLEDPDGPVAVAAVDGALARALSLRADGDEDTAREVLQDLYAANPENAQVEEALTDSSFGIVPTSADRIAARIAPWNRQDHDRACGRENLLRTRPFEERKHQRGSPCRFDRAAHRGDRGQDQRDHRQRP